MVPAAMCPFTGIEPRTFLSLPQLLPLDQGRKLKALLNTKLSLSDYAVKIVKKLSDLPIFWNLFWHYLLSINV